MRPIRQGLLYRSAVLLIKLMVVLVIWLPVLAALTALVGLRTVAGSVPERPELELLSKKPPARVVTSQGAYVGGRFDDTGRDGTPLWQ